MIVRSVALLCLVGILLAAPVAGEESWAYGLAGDLMSPYCPGRALSECPSPNAEKLRVWILDQEKAGRSQAEVEAQLYEQFGDQLRQSPKAEGVGLVAYAIPIVVFLGGGLLVAVFLQRARAASDPEPATPTPTRPTADTDLERLLDEQLER